MNNKRQELMERIEALINYTLIKMEQHSEGQLTDKQYENVLNFIDTEYMELEAEYAVMELVESVNLN